MIRKRHDAVDLLKMLLSFLIVFLHVPVFHDAHPEVIALCRVAVPVFFMTSAYFLFEKIRSRPGDRTWENECLHFSLNRQLKLYFCWLLVEIPMMYALNGLYAFGYEDGFSIEQTLRVMLRNLFLGNTFPASWYLMALMIGTVMVTLLSRRFSNTVLLAAGFVSYMICCMHSGYRNLTGFAIYFFYPPTSFLAAPLWLTIGKIVAEGGSILDRIRSMPKRKKRMLLLGSAILYGLEFLLSICLGWAENTDCILTLVPISVMLFLNVLENDSQLKRARQMRIISTVTYCSHGVILSLLLKTGTALSLDMDQLILCWVRYGLTLMICTLLALGMICLQRKKGFAKLAWFW